jgi:hypothetical protein
VIDGKVAIRVNLTNHRTTSEDLQRLLQLVRSRGHNSSRVP